MQAAILYALMHPHTIKDPGFWTEKVKVSLLFNKMAIIKENKIKKLIKFNLENICIIKCINIGHAQYIGRFSIFLNNTVKCNI